MAAPSRSAGLLAGIRVVEAATMVMVPSVGAAFADYGAQVVKLEPLEGDLNRRGHHIPGMPIHPTDYEYCFLPDNRGKRSLALDLKAPEAKGIVRRLVEDADVFLTNYRHRALERLGLTWPELQVLNPLLVYAHGTGFGDCGAEADKPGFDAVCYWSRSAMEATMFPMEGWLGSLGYGTGDHPSGMALFSAVLLALLARERTGRGTRVSSSLLANGAWSNSVLIQARLLETEFQERRPREQARNFTGVYYRAGDGRIFKMAVVDTAAGWPKVCRAIGRPDLIDDPRYVTLEERSKDGRMRDLILLCDQIFGSRPMEHWKRALEEADVPYSVVSTYDDVVADPQMAATGVFVEVDDPELGLIRTVDTPFQLEGHPKVAPRPAPRLGEHTREILTDLGMGEPEVDALYDRGVVATRPRVGTSGNTT
ncbi:MAG TPA: CoA transferase [Thermoanaerobaculia bacterium]|nr:CoA transferase [Thermoanaerobaculia bacterium]